MHTVFESLPLVAATLAVPQFLPQLSKIRRAQTAAGVSWSWATLTSVNNAAWLAYFALSGFWTALVPAVSATVLAGQLAVVLARRMGGVPRRPAMLALSWIVILACSAAMFGRAGLGTALAVAFLLQVTPSVWTVYRSEDRRLNGDVAADLRGAAVLGRVRHLRERPTADRARCDRCRGQRARAGSGVDGATSDAVEVGGGAMTTSTKLSYACGPSDVSMLGTTIGAAVDATVAAHPDREALVEHATGRRWTYRRIADQVDSLALGLRELGVGKVTGSGSGRRTAPSGPSSSSPRPSSGRSW